MPPRVNAINPREERVSIAGTLGLVAFSATRHRVTHNVTDLVVDAVDAIVPVRYTSTVGVYLRRLRTAVGAATRRQGHEIFERQLENISARPRSVFVQVEQRVATTIAVVWTTALHFRSGAATTRQLCTPKFKHSLHANARGTAITQAAPLVGATTLVDANPVERHNNQTTESATDVADPRLRGGY
jgi:hypothetical protein